MSEALKTKVLDQSGAKKKLGEILVEQGALSEEALALAVKAAEEKKVILGTILLEQGLVSPDALAQALAAQFEIPYRALSGVRVNPESVQGFPHEIALRYRIVPVARMPDQSWILCTDDPRAVEGNDLLRASLPKPYTLEVASRPEIDRILGRLFSGNRRQVEELSRKVAKAPTNGGAVSIDTVVDRLIQSAIGHNASDIHIDPADGFVRIRERIDGVLQETYQLDPAVGPPLTSKLKVLSNLDITEKRKPQDGRFRYTAENIAVDIRISSLPTMRGERVTLRLLNQSKSRITLDQTGLPEDMVRNIRDVLSTPHGIILVTGPTGSGKTTTVYAMLSHVNSIERNIITVEDPVEYQFELINQVQIQTKSGITFAEVLRNILRQDPDVIMVGEIRDRETAEIAIRAALTGHLVISTIHTNDSLSTISRLVDMGIDPLLISATLSAVVSQRLIRKLCDQCTNDGAAIGCDACNDTGYRGRLAVAEIMVPDNVIKQAITDRTSLVKMEEHLKTTGFRTMWENALNEMIDGKTTLSEAQKVKA